MSSQPTPRVDESTEAGRAFLQSRIALFWKVMFFLCLFGAAAGSLGALTRPGVDFLITIGLAVQSGISWWMARRRPWSIGALRTIENVSLLANTTASVVLWRYMLAGFLRDRGIVTAEGTLLADAYLSMFQMAGSSVMLAIRAAVVPSAPRRTVVLTAVIGVPLILAATFLTSAANGIAWRALNFSTHGWMPATETVMWTLTVITCTLISSVIYGLRVEVREARELGQYVLEQKIGEGGMGEVYRARHGLMRRPTALKLMRSDRVNESGIRRFEREVQLTARLTHPNTITIFDYGRTHDGVFYYAMELLDGATLQRIVDIDGRQKPGRVVRILTMVCGALSEAHGIGLIHRDLKPANIMLCTQGGERDVVKLLDFGLVKDLELDDDVELTAANALAGTPRYMAPEAFTAPGSIDARADLYAVGAIAYFLLAGTPVFNGKSTLELYNQHLNHEPEPLSARGVTVSPDLEAVVRACLEKDPARRPQSAADLRRQVQACHAGPWDADDARVWWARNQPLLDDPAAPAPVPQMTVAVNR